MIYTYFIVTLVIVVGGLAYYILFSAFDMTLTTLETAYPAYYSGGGPDFIYNFLRWGPFFLILVPLIIYVIVQSQKPQEMRP